MHQKGRSCVPAALRSPIRHTQTHGFTAVPSFGRRLPDRSWLFQCPKEVDQGFQPLVGRVWEESGWVWRGWGRGGGRMGRTGKELDKGPEAGRGGRVSRRGGGVPRAWVSGGSPEADGSRNSCSDNVFGGPFRKREPVFFPKRLRRHRFNKRKTLRFSIELDPENGIDGPTDGNQVSLSLKRPRTLLFYSAPVLLPHPQQPLSEPSPFVTRKLFHSSAWPAFAWPLCQTQAMVADRRLSCPQEMMPVLVWVIFSLFPQR